MTDLLEHTPDPADRPDLPPPGYRTAMPPPRSPARRLLRWWLLSSVVLVLACVACLAIGFGQLDAGPIHIIVNGDDVGSGFSIDGGGAGVKLLLAAGAVMLALLMLLIVPAVLLLVFGAVALALVAGLGVPLIAIALALGVLTSPLWLIGLLIWLALRRRPVVPGTIRA